jgi:ferredoxin-NADP reductase
MVCPTFPGSPDTQNLETPQASEYSTSIQSSRELSQGAFELELDRPPSFRFAPGQSIRLLHGATSRDYSLASAGESTSLALCIRKIQSGTLSTFLASAARGTTLKFTGPHGYFVFRPSARPAVFVATGTGIAPFASMARSGTAGFTLLHGVRTAEDLYYQDSSVKRQPRMFPAFPARALRRAGFRAPSGAV